MRFLGVPVQLPVMIPGALWQAGQRLYKPVADRYL